MLVRESIKLESHRPVYEQIVEQVIFDVATGSLPAGELIPSVRDLAGRLGVHPNTVARAFQKLEEKGVVTARRGKGMEVTAEAQALCKSERQKIVRERIREALQEAMTSALTASEIRRLVEEELAGMNGKGH